MNSRPAIGTRGVLLSVFAGLFLAGHPLAAQTSRNGSENSQDTLNDAVRRELEALYRRDGKQPPPRNLPSAAGSVRGRNDGSPNGPQAIRRPGQPASGGGPRTPAAANSAPPKRFPFLKSSRFGRPITSENRRTQSSATPPPAPKKKRSFFNFGPFRKNTSEQPKQPPRRTPGRPTYAPPKTLQAQPGRITRQPQQRPAQQTGSAPSPNSDIMNQLDALYKRDGKQMPSMRSPSSPPPTGRLAQPQGRTPARPAVNGNANGNRNQPKVAEKKPSFMQRLFGSKKPRPSTPPPKPPRLLQQPDAPAARTAANPRPRTFQEPARIAGNGQRNAMPTDELLRQRIRELQQKQSLEFDPVERPQRIANQRRRPLDDEFENPFGDGDGPQMTAQPQPTQTGPIPQLKLIPDDPQPTAPENPFVNTKPGKNRPAGEGWKTAVTPRRPTDSSVPELRLDADGPSLPESENPFVNTPAEQRQATEPRQNVADQSNDFPDPFTDDSETDADGQPDSLGNVARQQGPARTNFNPIPDDDGEPSFFTEPPFPADNVAQDAGDGSSGFVKLREPALDEQKAKAAERQAKMKLIAERQHKKGFKGFCPVTLRNDRDLVDAKPQFSAFYAARAYHFASEEALSEFRKNPAKYAPVAGGTDIIVLGAKSERIEGSLDHAVWFKDRLYLFSSRETLETFVGEPARFAQVR